MRFAAIAGAAALGVGILSTAAAGPAAAQDTVHPFLANDQNYAMYAAQGVKAGSFVGVDLSGGYWSYTGVGPTETLGNPRVTGDPVELKAVTSSGSVTNWCIAVTGGYDEAYLAACGANGTVFLDVPSGNGVLLYSRYFLDKGSDWVLAVDSPYNGAPVDLIPYNVVGGDWFGRWIL
jgi:hypothetical protein